MLEHLLSLVEAAGDRGVTVTDEEIARIVALREEDDRAMGAR